MSVGNGIAIGSFSLAGSYLYAYDQTGGDWLIGIALGAFIFLNMVSSFK